MTQTIVQKALGKTSVFLIPAGALEVEKTSLALFEKRFASGSGGAFRIQILRKDEAQFDEILKNAPNGSQWIFLKLISKAACRGFCRRLQIPRAR